MGGGSTDQIRHRRQDQGCALQAPDQLGRGSVLAAGAAGRAADQGEAARGEALPRRPGPAQVEAAQ